MGTKQKITVQMRDKTITAVAKEWEARLFEREMLDQKKSFVQVPGTNVRVRPSEVVQFSIDDVE